MNLEIAPTIINAGASTHTEYRPILSPVIDVGIFGAANVTVIPVSLGTNEYDVILAGASLPATFDPSGAGREIIIENAIIFCKENDYNFVCFYNVRNGKSKYHKDIIKVELVG
jgi:hypothetical protein